MMFSGGIAVVAGWWVSIIGLQPFVVNGTITQTEVLGTASSGAVLYGLIGYGLYALLLAAFAGMLFHAALRRGAGAQTGRRCAMIAMLAASQGLNPDDPSFWMPLAFMALLFVVIAAGVCWTASTWAWASCLAPAEERGRMMSLLSPWRDANEFWPAGHGPVRLGLSLRLGRGAGSCMAR